MTARMYSTTAILALFVTCICNAQQPAKLRISGDGIQPLEITAADLARMPRLTLDVRDPHTGNVHQYGGVRLSDVLSKAGAPLGDKLRGRAVSTCVLARAKDGYGVVYSLAELDPAMNDNQIIVADTTDAKPLDQQQGPFRVIVPGEKRPARWIRMVNSFALTNSISPSESSPR